MSGQSIQDRMTAAKHSIVGSGLAKTVCKATTEEVMGPKKKHVDYLVQCTHEPNVSIPQLANYVIERTQHSNWVVVFKGLVTLHSLMNHGNERFTQYLASNNCTLTLSNFIDKAGVQGYDMSTYIRRYAKYINEKAYSYRQMAFDFCKVKRGKEDGLLRTMNAEKLLKTLPTLQQQLDALLEFDVTPNELTNGVINAAFLLLFKDLIRLFACYNDGIINLLEKYFEMSRKQCKDGLDLYKKFVIRMDNVSKFLKTAESVGIDRGDIPDLAKAPSSLLEALEEHLKSLEGQKKTKSDKAKPVVKAAINQLQSPTSPTSGGAAVGGISEAEKKKILEEEEKTLEKLKTSPTHETSEQKLKQEQQTPYSPANAVNSSHVSVSVPVQAASADFLGASQPTQHNRPSDDLLGLGSSQDTFSGGLTEALQTAPSGPAGPSNPFGSPAAQPQPALGQPWGAPAQSTTVPPTETLTNGNAAASGFSVSDAQFAAAFGGNQKQGIMGMGPPMGSMAMGPPPTMGIGMGMMGYTPAAPMNNSMSMSNSGSDDEINAVNPDGDFADFGMDDFSKEAVKASLDPFSAELGAIAPPTTPSGLDLTAAKKAPLPPSLDASPATEKVEVKNLVTRATSPLPPPLTADRPVSPLLGDLSLTQTSAPAQATSPGLVGLDALDFTAPTANIQAKVPTPIGEPSLMDFGLEPTVIAVAAVPPLSPAGVPPQVPVMVPSLISTVIVPPEQQLDESVTEPSAGSTTAPLSPAVAAAALIQPVMAFEASEPSEAPAPTQDQVAPDNALDDILDLSIKPSVASVTQQPVPASPMKHIMATESLEPLDMTVKAPEKPRTPSPARGGMDVLDLSLTSVPARTPSPIPASGLEVLDFSKSSAPPPATSPVPGGLGALDFTMRSGPPSNIPPPAYSQVQQGLFDMKSSTAGQQPIQTGRPVSPAKPATTGLEALAMDTFIQMGGSPKPKKSARLADMIAASSSANASPVKTAAAPSGSEPSATIEGAIGAEKEGQGFDAFGEILKPQSSGMQTQAAAPAGSSSKLISSDIDSSLVSLVGNLNVNGATAKTSPAWNQQVGEKKRTGGTNWQAPVMSSSTLPPMNPYQQSNVAPPQQYYGQVPQMQMNGAPAWGMQQPAQPMGMGMNMGQPRPMGMQPQGMYGQPAMQQQGAMFGAQPPRPTQHTNDPFGSL